MDSISDLLQGKTPDEPPQLRALRDYVMERYGERSQASVSAQGYNLTVPNAGLASHLQMEMPHIVEQCGLDKKLFIRIGYF